VLNNRLISLSDGERLRLGPSKKLDPYGQPQKTGGKKRIDLDAIRKESPGLVEKHTTPGKSGLTFKLYRFGKEETDDDDE